MILDRMLEMGESGPGIIVMLTRYFANLWKLQELRGRRPTPDQATQLAEARLSRFEWGALQAASRSFSPGDVESAFPILCSADERLKSTGTDPRAILEPMIVQLAGPAAVHARR
jgi:DNA polymerase III delta subunit